MIKKIIQWVFIFVGMTLGFAIHYFVIDMMRQSNYEISPGVQWTALFLSIAVFGALFKALSPHLMKIGQLIISVIEKESSKLGVVEMVVAVFGIIIGLIISYFIGSFTMQIPFVGTAITIVVYMFFVFLGYSLSTRRKDEISTLIKSANIHPAKERVTKETDRIPPKILDTSVIIDGRIADIAATGFLEGKLLVPGFVLEELRHIADSSDDLKRVKGRRGLDILNTMQSAPKIKIENVEADFPEVAEVDMKLLRLAQKTGGKVLTNDYNLNKVAQLQGVEVLNISELAIPVKTVVIPGEELVVTIIKEGKEPGQGVAYFDDGTMIVIENAKKMIGETLPVVVTTVLQTAAGRMIFARPK